MYYGVRDRVIYTEDLSECNFQTVASDPGGKSFGKKLGDIAFHPDGRIYAINDSLISSINVHNGESEIVTPLADQNIDIRFGTLLISEEGDVLIAGQKKQILSGWFFDLRELSVLGTIDLNWILESSNIIGNGSLYSELNKKYIGGVSNQELILYNINKQTTEVLEWNNTPEQAIFGAAKSLPPCGEAVLLGFNPVIGVASNYAGLNVETGEFTQYCNVVETNTLAYATPTDFRRSTLRIDLDKDNSSGHITAGYYDTLTTCSKKVPVMDDVELYTCGQEVDSISFRLRYYDIPRLPEERIYSEDFADPEQTSPDRYVWKNIHRADEDKIKEYLRSLRYQADWTDPDEKERVVMTTMHVGEDSTTSWSVYQLETDEVYAGQDTTITYCPEDISLELIDYLSSGVSTDGRIEPELDAGGTVFTPGKDADGDYLYILQNMDCADTAVLTVESLETGLEDIGLDTVTVCSSERVRIGFPPGKYDSIEWWDGSTGDSTWISADDTGHFVIVNQDGCGITVPITVIEQDVQGIAGRDTTIQYCAGGTVIDLTKILGLPDEYSCEIIPALSNGSLIFDPAVDATGTYQLMARIKSCTDTIAIVMEETMTQELVLDPVRLCAGTSQRIGLVQGVYDQVIWWNGDSGDSTTISNMDTGPFTVEAEKDGCTYQGEVDLTIVPEVVVPDYYPEQLTICAGETQMIPVSGLDSVLWENSIYYPGEDIILASERNHCLIGYQGGCFTEMAISVEVMEDPSAGYQKTIDWCSQSASGGLTLKLPEDNANWRFRWADGTDSTSRTIGSKGRYPFLIISDSCEYTSFFEVVGDADCDEECIVSIPNAITPNGDGINDNLEVFSECAIKVIEIRIFDKWGGELYRVQGGEVQASVWANLLPGMVMVQVTYEAGQGVVKTEVQGVLVVK